MYYNIEMIQLQVWAWIPSCNLGLGTMWTQPKPNSFSSLPSIMVSYYSFTIDSLSPQLKLVIDMIYFFPLSPHFFLQLIFFYILYPCPCYPWLVPAISGHHRLQLIIARSLQILNTSRLRCTFSTRAFMFFLLVPFYWNNIRKQTHLDCLYLSNEIRSMR